MNWCCVTRFSYVSFSSFSCFLKFLSVLCKMLLTQRGNVVIDKYSSDRSSGTLAQIICLNESLREQKPADTNICINRSLYILRSVEYTHLYG